MSPLLRKTIYEKGFVAGYQGKSIETGRYSIPERLAVWVRGFRDGQHQSQVDALSNDEITNARRNVSRLKKMLGLEKNEDRE